MLLTKKLPKFFTNTIRETDTHIFFWNSFMSNFFNLFPIYFDGFKVRTSEHIFMYLKAKRFNDVDMIYKIVNCESPAEAKKFGRKVKNYDDEIWKKERKNAMYHACLAKFSQNIELKNALLLTEDKILVEASPYDRIWGIGIHYADDDCLDPSNWKGLNLLGEVLMEVREILKKTKQY